MESVPQVEEDGSYSKGHHDHHVNWLLTGCGFGAHVPPPRTTKLGSQRLITYPE